MSVPDPAVTHHHDTLQQGEDIANGSVVAVVVVSTIVFIIGGFIAWFLLLFFFDEVRPGLSVTDYPERHLGEPGEIKDLAIEQVFFELPVQPGEADRTKQVKALHSFGKSAVDANTARIPIDEAMKLYIKQEGEKK